MTLFCRGRVHKDTHKSMGANNSVPSELASQCHLPQAQVKKLLKAFQKKNKKGRPINLEVFKHVLNKLDEDLRAKSPLLLNPDNISILFATLDSNHDGSRTNTIHRHEVDAIRVSMMLISFALR